MCVVTRIGEQLPKIGNHPMARTVKGEIHEKIDTHNSENFSIFLLDFLTDLQTGQSTSFIRHFTLLLSLCFSFE